MSNAIQSFAIIHNNPFIFSPIFPVFYSAISHKPKSLLLSYLVLPIVLFPESKKFLVNARSTSSMRTLVSERDRLYGLGDGGSSGR